MQCLCIAGGDTHWCHQQHFQACCISTACRIAQDRLLCMHLAYHGLMIHITVSNVHVVTELLVTVTKVGLSWQDVEPGRPVRSQLASAAKSPEEAFRRMKNKTFVVETKFDGQSSWPLSVQGPCYQCCLLNIS